MFLTEMHCYFYIIQQYNGPSEVREVWSSFMNVHKRRDIIFLAMVLVMDEFKLGDIPGVYNYGQEKIEDVDKVSKSYICSTRHWN